MTGVLCGMAKRLPQNSTSWRRPTQIYTPDDFRDMFTYMDFFENTIVSDSSKPPRELDEKFFDSLFPKEMRFSHRIVLEAQVTFLDLMAELCREPEVKGVVGDILEAQMFEKMQLMATRLREASLTSATKFI